MLADAPKASTDADEERDRKLASPLSSFFAGPAAEPVNLVTATPGAKVLVDERVAGVTPVSLLLAPGEHAVVVHVPSGEKRETVHVDARPHASQVRAVVPNARTFSLGEAVPVASASSIDPAHGRSAATAPTAASSTVLPVAVDAPFLGSPAPTAVGGAAPESPSASELLAAARERRVRGDHDGSVRAYRELFSRHGTSLEAHAALVPFGEIQLARLADPGGALSSFDRYLARGGPLSEEASYGRLRALRALGRTVDERAGIEVFLRMYPDSNAASSLRERMRVIGTP